MSFFLTFEIFLSVNNFLGILICKINVLNTFWMVDLSKIFVSLGSIPGKYSWECNDTPSLSDNWTVLLKTT